MDSGIMQAFLMKVYSVFWQLSQEQVACFTAEWFFSGNGRAENNPPRWSIAFRHPSPAKNHKTTIIPLGGFWRFFRGGRCGKSNALSEAAFLTSTPLKNRCNRGGDDRQVSQNGMPFCTGCALSEHILNLQGSFTPFEPLAGSPKNETAKHPLEVSPFHFQIRWGMYLLHLIDASRCFREALSKLCDLCPWQIISGIVQIAFLQVSLAGRKFVKHMPDFWKNHCWNFCRLIFCLRSMFLLWYCRVSGRE